MGNIQSTNGQIYHSQGAPQRSAYTSHMCAGATQTPWYGCEGMVVNGSVSNYFFPDLINLKRWRQDADYMRWWSDGGQAQDKNRSKCGAAIYVRKQMMIE